MQLTRHTDHALRLLMHLADADGQLVAIGDVAHAQNISRSHLMKIANGLTHDGFIKAIRGKGGGVRLGRPAHQINLDDVFTATQSACSRVDCTTCTMAKRCGLPQILSQAQSAFRSVLAGYTLADIAGVKETTSDMSGADGMKVLS